MARRHPVTAVALVCALMLQASAGRADDLLDRVLATVEGRVITLSDVRTAARFGLVPTHGSPDVMTATLDGLINRLVILAEVERYAPPEPDPTAIREGVARIHARFPSEEDLAAALRVAGFDEAALVQWARNDLRIARYLDERFAGAAEPTDEDIEGYMRRHEADLQRAGHRLDDPEVLRLARERVAAERHQAVVAEWVEGLRARAGVSTTPPLGVIQ
jgi:hypothetical protein